MTSAAESLLEQALHLGEAERADLAGALVESLYGAREPGVEAAWDAVVARRVAELDAGSVTTVPWSEVSERLFRGLE